MSKLYEEDVNVPEKDTLGNIIKENIDYDQYIRIEGLRKDYEHLENEVRAGRLALSRAKESFAKTIKEIRHDEIKPIEKKVMWLSVVVSLMLSISTMVGGYYVWTSLEKINKSEGK